jgi:hypothetical protein
MLIIFYCVLLVLGIRLLVLWIKRLREERVETIVQKEKIPTKMDPMLFWKIIDESRRGTATLPEHILKLKDELNKLTALQVVEFANRFEVLKNKAYRWDLWGAIYLLAGGCSDDSFEYFREWLIAQGKEKFERALKDPESIKDYADPTYNWEGLGYCAAEIYQEKTRKKYIPVDIKAKDAPSGEEWDEDKLPEMFPAIAEHVKSMR